MYEKVGVTLNMKQFDKLMKGHPIQLNHAQLMGNRHWLATHPETAKKMHHAKSRHKGVRISMTPHELEASGEGIKEFWEKLKGFAQNVGSTLKKGINSDFYQQNLKPIVRQAVNAAYGAVAPEINAINPQLGNIAQKGVDFVGSKSNAYGIRPRGRPRARRPMHHQANPYLSGEQVEWPEPVYNAVKYGAGPHVAHRGRPKMHRGSGSFLPA